VVEAVGLHWQRRWAACFYAPWVEGTRALRLPRAKPLAASMVAQDSTLKSCGFSRFLTALKYRKSEMRDLRYIPRASLAVRFVFRRRELAATVNRPVTDRGVLPPRKTNGQAHHGD